MKARPDANRTGGGPSQVDDMRRVSGGAPDIARQCPDVGALAHIEGRGPHGVAVDLVDGDQVGRIHLDRACGQLDILACAGTLVGANTVDGDSRKRRRDLVELAHKIGEQLLGEHRRQQVVAHGGRAGHLALVVIGRGLGSEHDARKISLSVERDPTE
ncbi:Uncharacterised protein [Collinsella intestinalis]|nr:Uncharacterised protein [Collinsella intestinalis]